MELFKNDLTDDRRRRKKLIGGKKEREIVGSEDEMGSRNPNR